MNNTEQPYYLSKLAYEFELKKCQNARFSLRAFAKKLALDPGTLSRILRGERTPSLQLGARLAAFLGLNQEESDLFLNSLATHKARLEGVLTSAQESFKLELDTYRFLSDWIHYALLELTFTKDFKNDFEWMAARLGRKANEVEEAIQRLKGLGLLIEENGELRKTQTRITTGDKQKTTLPLRKLQKDFLEKASEALDHVELAQRIAVSMTMAIDPKNMEKARSLCVEFSERLCDVLEEGEPTEVYNLIVNLSPLTQLNSNGVLQQ